MWRKLYREIEEWKDDPDRMVLLLEGVRQCGKTYLLKRLGEEHFPDGTIYVNFEKDRRVHSIFEKDFDVHRIIDALGIYYNKGVIPGRTLIILDEIQECGKAMTCLKYFSEEAQEYHVACAGSLIGLLTNKESFPVGKVRWKRLYPMTFLEFLRAEGEEKLYEYLHSKDPSEPLSDSIHSMALDHLRNYYIVGGMPSAVDSWVRYRNITKVTEIQRSLLKDYRDDFSKHGSKMLSELTSIWGSIPNQLMKDNRRMMLKDVLPRGRAEVFHAPLEWLTNAGLIHCVYLADSPFVPLSEVKDPSMFKVYPCDPGLLRAMSGVPASFIQSTEGEYRLFKGAMAETFAVCSLRASGYTDDICYWKSEKSEVDIMVSSAAGVVPIEVKYGNASKGKSLDRYSERYGPDVAVHLSANNASRGSKMSVPLYSCETLMPFINSHDEDAMVPSPDPSMPFTRFFGAGDWSAADGSFTIRIPYAVHNRNPPAVIQVFEGTGSDGYRSVNVSVTVAKEGDVIIEASERFSGKLSIM